MITRLLNYLQHLHKLYIFSILFLIAFVAYANTLGNGLFFDDEHFIYNNQAVITFDLEELWGRSLTSGAGKLSNYYRPLLFTGFGIEYALFADTPFIYHLTSLLIHTAGGIILYLILEKLTKSKPLSLLTSLLFLIHPLQTEAVSYASGRGDPLSFFFVMLTVYWSLSSKRIFALLSFVTLIAALLSKEIALMAPGLIFIVHFFSQENSTLLSIRKSIRSTLPYAAIAIGYFVLRITVLNFANTLNFYDASNVYSSNLIVRLFTFFHYFPDYIFLLIFPKDLFMERDTVIDIITQPTLPVLISVLGVLLLLGIGMWKKQSKPFFLFSLLWIGITFVPTSGIIPINGIFYEHFLYYPSVGFFLLFSLGIFYLIDHLPKFGKEIIGLLVLILICGLVARTIARNGDWRDPVTFYQQTLSHVPSARAYNNLAMAYADKKNYEKAIESYKKAISIVDAYPESHYNLANAYLSLNDISHAEKEYREALRIDPTFYLAYIALYRIYAAENNTEGITSVKDNLTQLGEHNSGFLQILRQLESQNSL